MPTGTVADRGHILAAEGECLIVCAAQLITAFAGAAAGHRTHLEHLQLDALAANQRPGFIPINLSFDAPVITQRHERLAGNEPQLLPPALHIATHRTLTDRKARLLGT